MIFETWIATTLSILIGFCLAKVSSWPKEEKEELVRIVKKKLKGKQRLGAIKTLLPEELAKRGTVQEETEKAMEETLDEKLKADKLWKM